MLKITPELVEELKNPSSFQLGQQFPVPDAAQLIPPREWHAPKLQTFMQKLFSQVVAA